MHIYNLCQMCQIVGKWCWWDDWILFHPVKHALPESTFWTLYFKMNEIQNGVWLLCCTFHNFWTINYLITPLCIKQISFSLIFLQFITCCSVIIKSRRPLFFIPWREQWRVPIRLSLIGCHWKIWYTRHCVKNKWRLNLTFTVFHESRFALK